MSVKFQVPWLIHRISGTEGKPILEVLQEMYEMAMSNIGDAVVRIEKFAELEERQVHGMDLETFLEISGLQPCARYCLEHLIRGSE